MSTSVEPSPTARSGDRRGTVGVTGAYGYLGGEIRAALERRGFSTVALVRTPRDGDDARRHELTAPVSPELFDGIDSLVHCSYDFGVTDRDDIWRVNVDGSKRLLEAAAAAGVERIVTISSMSAYDGTAQLYGSAKLEIEAATTAVGGISLRPGLVYGDEPGGMVGALLKLTALPATPIVGAGSRQFLIHEDDLSEAVVDVVAAAAVPAVPVSLSTPRPYPFKDVLRTFAVDAGQSPRFVPVPWRAVFWAIKAAELLPPELPFRSDSLLGLVRPAPGTVGDDVVRDLGIAIRPFQTAP